DLLVIACGQGSLIEFERTNVVWIGDRLQGTAVMIGLTAGFAATDVAWFLVAMRIAGWWHTAVAAVHTQAHHQQLHDDQHQGHRGLHGGGGLLILLQLFFDSLDGGLDVDRVERHNHGTGAAWDDVIVSRLFKRTFLALSARWRRYLRDGLEPRLHGSEPPPQRKTRALGGVFFTCAC